MLKRDFVGKCACFWEFIVKPNTISSVMAETERTRRIFSRLFIYPPPELCNEEMEIFQFECEQNTDLATEGVTTDPAKLKTLQKWPTPKNTHDLMSCNSLVVIVTRLWVGRCGVEPL